MDVQFNEQKPEILGKFEILGRFWVTSILSNFFKSSN